MENVKKEMRYQIIIDFHQNHEAKGKLYTVAHFTKIEVGKRQVVQYESGKSYQHQDGKRTPKKADTKGGSRRHQKDGK